jgi:hypothetical protein
VQKTRSDVSEATVVTHLGAKNDAPVFPGPIKGYVETAFSLPTGRYYYKGSKLKSFRGFGSLSLVEEYDQSFPCAACYLVDVVLNGNPSLCKAEAPAVFFGEGLACQLTIGITTIGITTKALGRYYFHHCSNTNH